MVPDPDLCALELSGAPITIGRGDCGCVLSGREISRIHARIEPIGQFAFEYAIVDLNSDNGLFVNGKRVGTARLAHGDVLRMGEWVGVVTLKPAEAAPFGIGNVDLSFRSEHGMLIGPSLAPAMQLARVAAEAGLSIAIIGETGTGKELLARAIHTWAKRPGKYVAVNCAAIPKSVAESELFGHRRGSFTGATENQPGLLRSAHQGTLLLDELHKMPLDVQSKLLRAIQEREVQGIGESDAVKVDLFIVAASQRPLRELVDRDELLLDLQTRLEQVVVQLLPLRDRNADLGYLIRESNRRINGGQPFSMEARFVEALCVYKWPGNLRELSKVLETVIALHRGESLLRHDYLPEHLKLPPAEPVPARSAEAVVGGSSAKKRSEPSQEQVEEAVTRCGGNVSEAAKMLGIPRQRMYLYVPKKDLPRFRATPADDDGSPVPGDDPQ